MALEYLERFPSLPETEKEATLEVTLYGDLIEYSKFQIKYCFSLNTL